MANVHTKKEYAGSREMPVKKAEPSKTVSMKNMDAVYKGQLSGTTGDQPFSNPLNKGAPAQISGIAGLHDDIGEKSGFITDGYLDKNGMVYGEAAKFNYLPPGMDISNQQNMEVHMMPLRVYGGGVSFPDDGWSPKPSDVQE